MRRATAIIPFLTITFLFSSFLSKPESVEKSNVEFKIEKDHKEDTHSIMLDVTGKHGTVILTTETGQIMAYKTFLSSTGEVTFHGLASGTYVLCVKQDRHTFVESITIP
jgi:hypothetical protein